MSLVIPGSRRELFKDLLRVPSVQHTARLLGIVCWHYGMSVRLTTTLHPLCTVQDVEGDVVGFEPDPRDHSTQARFRCCSGTVAEHHCGAMPLCI